MTRFLVTGAGGFVGSHIVQRLVTDPSHHVVCIDSFRHNGDIGRLADAVPEKLRDRVTVLIHNLRAPLTARALYECGDLDAIIDVASSSSVDESIAYPGDFILNNVAVTVNTLDAARELACPHVVHISTDEVYGAHDELCRETDHRPSNPYSASKAAQEDVCHAYRSTFSVNVSIVTSSNMFGERQSQRAFIPRVVRAALDDHMVSIHTHHGVPGRRQYTYVGEVADFITSKLTTTLPNDWPERVALSGRHNVGNDEIVTAIGDAIGSTVRFRLVDGGSDRPGYDHKYPMLSDPGSEFNDWDTRRSQTFTEQLTRTVNWFTTHPEWLR